MAVPVLGLGGTEKDRVLGTVRTGPVTPTPCQILPCPWRHHVGKGQPGTDPTGRVLSQAFRAQDGTGAGRVWEGLWALRPGALLEQRASPVSPLLLPFLALGILALLREAKITRGLPSAPQPFPRGADIS